eukprot:s1787_g8.t1
MFLVFTIRPSVKISIRRRPIMVIPIGGMGVPLMGPPPPEVAHRFRVIKYSILILILCTIGELVAGILGGAFGQMLVSSLNLILNALIGVWMLKDDATIGRIYAFLGRSCCKPCTEQCQGGLTCLMPFIICNLITVLLGLILNNDIGEIIGAFKAMLNSVTFYEAFVFMLLFASTVGALLSQVVGCIYGYLAYREIRDSGVHQTGGDWGNSYPQAEEAWLLQHVMFVHLPTTSLPFREAASAWVAERTDGARYVEPFPEAGSAEDAGEAGATQLEHRIGSWADVEIPEEEEVEEAEEAEGDFEAWTKSLQWLRQLSGAGGLWRPDGTPGIAWMLLDEQMLQVMDDCVDGNHGVEDWTLYGIGCGDRCLKPAGVSGITARVFDYLDTPLHSMCLDFYVFNMDFGYNMFLLLAYNIMDSSASLHLPPFAQVQQDVEKAEVEKDEPLEPTPWNSYIRMKGMIFLLMQSQQAVAMDAAQAQDLLSRIMELSSAATTAATTANTMLENFQAGGKGGQAPRFGDGAKLLRSPEVFETDDPVKYAHWREQFLNWITFCDSRYAELIKDVEQLETMTDMATLELPVQDLATKLYSILSSYLQGPALQVVRAHSAQRNGFSLLFGID